MIKSRGPQLGYHRLPPPTHTQSKGRNSEIIFPKYPFIHVIVVDLDVQDYRLVGRDCLILFGVSPYLCSTRTTVPLSHKHSQI